MLRARRFAAPLGWLEPQRFPVPLPTFTHPRGTGRPHAPLRVVLRGVIPLATSVGQASRAPLVESPHAVYSGAGKSFAPRHLREKTSSSPATGDQARGRGRGRAACRACTVPRACERERRSSGSSPGRQRARRGSNAPFRPCWRRNRSTGGLRRGASRHVLYKPGTGSRPSYGAAQRRRLRRPSSGFDLTRRPPGDA